jgi:hypothetical protein
MLHTSQSLTHTHNCALPFWLWPSQFIINVLTKVVPLMMIILRLKDLHYCEVMLKIFARSKMNKKIKKEAQRSNPSMDALKGLKGSAVADSSRGTIAMNNDEKSEKEQSKQAAYTTSSKASYNSSVDEDNVNDVKQGVKHATIVVTVVAFVLFVIAAEGISSAACSSSSTGNPSWSDGCKRKGRPAFYRFLGSVDKAAGKCPCATFVCDGVDNATCWLGMHDSLYLRSVFLRNTSVPALPEMVPSVTRLTVEHGGVVDISALQKSINLKQVDLMDNPDLKNISALRGLTFMYVFPRAHSNASGSVLPRSMESRVCAVWCVWASCFVLLLHNLTPPF